MNCRQHALRIVGWFVLAVCSGPLAAAPAEKPAGQEAARSPPACGIVLGKHVEAVCFFDEQRGKWYNCVRKTIGKYAEGVEIEATELNEATCESSVRRGPGVFVPPGSYQVTGVTLEGGFAAEPCNGSAAADRVELIAGRPFLFEARTPLMPTVVVKRVGGVLQLDYHLLDGDGRNYCPWHVDPANWPKFADPANWPQFAVYQGDRRIGSGTFSPPDRENITHLPSWRAPISVGNRDLRIVASQDIGPLGPKDGPPAIFHWHWYYSFPTLPCWAILLVLLLAPKTIVISKRG